MLFRFIFQEIHYPVPGCAPLFGIGIMSGRLSYKQLFRSINHVVSGVSAVSYTHLFLLYQLIEEILAEEPDANIIYVNLEDFTFSSQQTAEDLHPYIISHSKEKVKNYIFIDEIQDIPGFEKVIRSLLLNEDNDIYLSLIHI